ncbi:MAG: peptidoglycan-binding protein [Clostridia bacterium]|nr:peptidoglycan-binding protein [Clostridia bacterium]
MERINWKRLLLIVFVGALLIGVSGCLIKPDTTLEEQPEPVQVLPFEMPTATPTPAPTEEGGQSGWDAGQPTETIAIATAPPTPVPTIALITAPPTPVVTAPPVSTRTPPSDGSLRRGDNGQAVRDLQQKLKNLGYYTGSVDGDFGAGTESALKAFQSANGLASDGVAGSRTMSALNSSNAKPKATASTAYATNRPTPNSYTPSTPNKYRYLQMGSSGTEVRKLQERLRELGYYNGSVNGSFGADTEAAVIAFQQRNGLWADGVAGEDTQNMLFSNSALANKKSEAYTPANVTYGYRSLRTGMTGDDVRQLQMRLTDLYYYAKAVDSTYSQATEQAVRGFQQRNGLTVDGVAGSDTQAKLYSSLALPAPTAIPTAPPYQPSATLQVGSLGEDVYRLQERLFDLGYYSGRIDGIYSETVMLAVRAFQTANKLTVDGKAGVNTQTRIFGANAVAAASANDNAYTTLRQGDSGERVRALQGLLTSFGYYTGTITGVYDGATVIAVQQFQAANSLIVDGIAGPATQQLLYNGNPKPAATPSAASFAMAQPNYPTLRQGMNGPDVMVLQQTLKDRGLFFNNVDGAFGASTLIAVQAFQAQNNLKADGIAGPETLALLYSAGMSSMDALSVAQWENAGLVATVRTTMRQGDEGQDVFDMQSRLTTLGYLSGAQNGVFGAETRSAVTEFQRRNGLTADGVAGPATIAAMYGVGVVPASSAAESLITSNLSVVTNNARELEEQRATGAISASLSGGGVAASNNSRIYYAGGGNGSLYMSYNGTETQLYASPVRFIHATDRGVTFVSGSRILRVPNGGGTAETLATEAGTISKLSMVGDTMYYQEGKSLIRRSSTGERTVLAANVNDFMIDIFQYTAYIATPDGVKNVTLNGTGETLLSSMPANQVQLCDSVVFYRSGGGIYRIENGISTLLLDADASWMGIYRDKVYYISGRRLYRCDTNGQNADLFAEDQVSGVSFVAGKAYITGSQGGPVTRILPV